MALDLTPVADAPVQDNTPPKLDLTPVESPRLPDTSGIQKMARDNIALKQQGEESQPQTPTQNLDTAMGYKTFGRAQDTPLPAAVREHAGEAMKNGTASSVSDYMQAAIPSVMASIRGFGRSLIPSTAAFAAFEPGAEAGALAGTEAAPFLGPLAPAGPVVGGLVGGFGASIAASSATGKAQQLALESAPKVAEALGQSPQQQAEDEAKHPISTFAGEMAPNAIFMRPGLSSVKNMAIGGAIMGAQETGREALSDEKMSPEKIAISAGAGALLNTKTDIGSKISNSTMALISAGHDALKPIIGKMSGLPDDAVTPDHIDQTIHKEYSGEPTAQDFHDAATALFGHDGADKGAETLNNIWQATGVKPEQVFEDAKNSPDIAKDISAGNIPKAYDSLRKKFPAPTPEENDRMKRVFNMGPPKDDLNNIREDTLADSAKDKTAPESILSKEGPQASINPLGHIFNPSGQSESSADMATAIRQGRGPAAQRTAEYADQLQKYSKAANSLDKDQQLDMIHYIEKQGEEGHVPDSLKPAADDIARIYKEMLQKAKEVFPDMGNISGYFTHQYTDESAAKKFYKDFSAKQGSARNLQEREFPTLKDAMKEGLEPKTTNPIETVMTYVRNMNNLIAAHESLKLAQEAGIADYFKRGQQPDGWVPLNGNLSEKGGGAYLDKFGNPRYESPKTLYAPEDAARVYNNDVSEKATGPLGSIIDNVNHANNFVSKLTLGLSGYHAVATTMASMSSDVGRLLTGGENTGGSFASALLSTLPDSLLDKTGIGSDVGLGAKIENAYLGRDQLPDHLQKVLDLAIKNNAIAVKQQDYWKAGPAKDWVDSFKNGTLLSEFKQSGQEIKQSPLTGTAKVIASEVGRAMDTITKPLFDVYIPRMKNAALIQEGHDWLQKHPDATPAEQDKAIQDIGNSIDNRFGEMMRDNLFWHQYTRQTLQMGLLSYSWVTGAARMLGGVTDAGMAMVGKKELSSNAKYLMGMAATYAVINGVRTYIGTGKPPDDWKDFVWPRTGGTTPQGQPERELLPGHIGQFTNYLHDGIAELGNEASPGLKLLYHVLANKDFRGLPITNDNNPWYNEQRWEDYLKYTLHEVEPIGLKNFIMGQKNGSHISSAENILGARQAPQFITDPEGYKKMMEAINNKAYQKKTKSDQRMESQYTHEEEAP